MDRYFLLFFIAISSLVCKLNAQMILNAESLRVTMLKNKNDWSGRVGLAFSFTKNTNDIYNINSNISLGYNGGKNLWMIISNLNLNKVEGVAFQNSGIQHARYNHQFNSRLTYEAFLQAQYDGVFAIDFRGLAGSGVRFEITKKSNAVLNDSEEKPRRSRIFIGALVMYEYEKASEIESNIVRKDFRSSNYLSVSLFPTNQVTIIGTTYFQPRLNNFSDYRISSEINLSVGFSSSVESEEKNFWDHLNMNLSISYNYDAFPVFSIPKTQYNISNGLVYTF